MKKIIIQTLIFTSFLIKSDVFSMSGKDNVLSNPCNYYIQKNEINIYETSLSVWSSKVFINECVPIPDSREKEWVEIFNNSDKKLNLTGWKIIDNAGKIKELSGEVVPNGFIVFEPIPVVLNNDGDKLLLVDEENNLADKFEYGGNNLTSNEGESIGRDFYTGQILIFNNPTKGTLNSVGLYSLEDVEASIDNTTFDPTNGVPILINLNISAKSDVSIKIFKQNGDLEKTIYEEKNIDSGASVIFWDGKNKNDEYAKSGKYICYIVVKRDGLTVKKELLFNVLNNSKKKTACVITHIIADKNVLKSINCIKDKILFRSGLGKKIVNLYYLFIPARSEATKQSLKLENYLNF